QTRQWYNPAVSDDLLGAALELLVALPVWLGTGSESRRDRAALKDMTRQLIGRFCIAAHDHTHERFGEGHLTPYGAHLGVPDATLAETVALNGVTAHDVTAPRES